MTPPLPPERDLPPRRHAAIRDELVTTVTDGRDPQPQRRAHRWIAPVSVAAAVAVVAGASTVGGLIPTDLLSIRDNQPAGAPPSAPASPSPSPTGTTADRAAQIVAECTKSAAVSTWNVATPSPFPATLVPTPPATPASATRTPVPAPPSDGELVLRNVVTDELGTVAFLVGRRGLIACTAPRGKAFTGSLSTTPRGISGWIPGAFSIDAMAAGATKATATASGERVTPESETVMGRVDRRVATVTVTGLNGVQTRAVLANGTFVARILHAPGRPVVGRDQLIVRAFDARGTLLGALDAYNGSVGCYLTPDGMYVGSRPERKGVPCKSATPWP